MSSLVLVLVVWFPYLRLRCSFFFRSTNGAIVTSVFHPQKTSQQKINIRVWLGGCWVSCSDLFTHQSWMYWVVSCFFPCVSLPNNSDIDHKIHTSYTETHGFYHIPNPGCVHTLLSENLGVPNFHSFGKQLPILKKSWKKTSTPTTSLIAGSFTHPFEKYHMNNQIETHISPMFWGETAFFLSCHHRTFSEKTSVSLSSSFPPGNDQRPPRSPHWVASWSIKALQKLSTLGG